MQDVLPLIDFRPSQRFYDEGVTRCPCNETPWSLAAAQRGLAPLQQSGKSNESSACGVDLSDAPRGGHKELLGDVHCMYAHLTENLRR